MTEFILIRHGETDWNRENRVQGHFDIELNADGIAQANLVASRMSKESFDVLYTSDLMRAKVTAEMIAAKTGHQVFEDIRLREYNMGIFQGEKFSELRKIHPKESEKFFKKDAEYKIPGGESRLEKLAMLKNFFQELQMQYHGKRIVCVTHGGVLMTMLRYVLGVSQSQTIRAKLFNTAINRFYLEPDGTWVLGTWGEHDHLGTPGHSDEF